VRLRFPTAFFSRKNLRMSISGNPRAVILLYHRLAITPSDPWRLGVEPARFEEQLDVLRSRFRPLPLTLLVQAARDGNLPQGAVAVTFDDGYRDNLYIAKPLVERYGVPATIFVITSYIGSSRDFWWDELERLCTSLRERENGEEKRLRMLERLKAEAGESPATDRTTISADELLQLADGDLIEVGAHTVTHPLLPRLSRFGQLGEINSSKQQLEELLARRIESFSYPYGAYGDDTVACVSAAGFAYACTSVAEPVTNAAHPLKLPRYRVDNWSGDELEKHLRGWLEV
jgi:peptidoglycan/xylan/chitin deacetylase (PgdA/CDA1 family)